MPQMTCPVCKNHCLLTVEEQAGAITVSGNKCARGDLYGREELKGERKIVTYHAPTAFADIPFGAGPDDRRGAQGAGL